MSLKLTDEEICKVIINEDSELDIALDRVLEALHITHYSLDAEAILHELIQYTQDGMSLEEAIEYVIQTHER